MIFYNNNIKLENNITNVEKEEQEMLKNEIVKNMLSPIRIQVKDVEGILFSKKRVK